jgi:hypothetical protein
VGADAAEPLELDGAGSDDEHPGAKVTAMIAAERRRARIERTSRVLTDSICHFATDIASDSAL